MQLIQIPTHWMRIHQAGVDALRIGLFNDAFKYFERFLRQWPNHAGAWSNLGNVYWLTGQHRGALEAFERAVKIDPKFWHFSFNLGVALLAHGRYRRGFGLELARLVDQENTQYQRFRAHPLWHGQQVGTLCIYHDQGYGDQLLTTRFIAMAQQRCKRLVVDMGAGDFVDLYRRSVPADVEIRLHTEHHPEIPAADAYSPMLALPWALKAHRQSYWPPPTLKLLSDEINAAKQRLRREADGRPTVFLNWRGADRNPWEAWRSPGLTAYTDLIRSRSDLFWFNCNPETLAEIGTSKLPVTLLKGTWLETAAYLAAADHAISSCTASAHLLGIMGRPGAITLSLTPYWVWGLTGTHSHLYPRLTLFRQTDFNDWRSVIGGLDKYISVKGLTNT